ncbi:MAG: FAD:protein FMN transferase [Proteobacteria bacterium]|nr:FAD:protein FMN transferase [Pseudomonadota bacterium]
MKTAQIPAPAFAGPLVSLQRLRPLLGTWVSIEAHCATREQGLRAIESAFEAVRSVGHCLHPLEPGSDLTRIAQAPAGKRVTIDSRTWEVLALAVRLHRASGGVFDPCIPSSEAGLTALRLSPPARNGRPPWWVELQERVTLDCGGIAKGYAVDCAVAALRSAGCVSGLVNAGGDLRAFGPREYTVMLRRAGFAHGPPQTRGMLVLRDAALAVSEVDASERPPQHRGYYDRTRPHAARGTACVAGQYAAVLAPSAMVADALTKCVLLSTPPVTKRLLSLFAARQL